MKIALHKLATTTPAIRKEIQCSELSSKDLGVKFGVSLDTINKWKRRASIYDRSHKRKNLLSTVSKSEEEIIIELRNKLNLSLDDVVEVMNRCLNPKLTRSSIYRAMKRCGVAQRPTKAGEATTQRFEEVSKPGHIHMDVKYLTKLNGKRSYTKSHN